MRLLTLCLLLAFLAAGLIPTDSALASEPLVSGPAAGARYGPYSFLIATGPKRGTQHCYVCDTLGKPVVIVFARQTSDELGKLLVEIDRMVATKRDQGFFAWATFLADDETAIAAKVETWGRQLGLRSLPLGVFEDADGPPTYRLSRDAETTILVVNESKVVANFAFKANELTADQATAVVEAARKLVK
ncbi:MAG TPA: hypothetical protein PKD86_19000 [Gemmatales bacterium]|nr:hypothetical protein [Gemmatales bacterium]HMP61435.1 hypothetical protein [Gemmatales bacterium]